MEGQAWDLPLHYVHSKAFVDLLELSKCSPPHNLSLMGKKIPPHSFSVDSEILSTPRFIPGNDSGSVSFRRCRTAVTKFATTLSYRFSDKYNYLTNITNLYVFFYANIQCKRVFSYCNTCRMFYRLMGRGDHPLKPINQRFSNFSASFFAIRT